MLPMPEAKFFKSTLMRQKSREAHERYRASFNMMTKEGPVRVGRGLFFNARDGP